MAKNTVIVKYYNKSHKFSSVAYLGLPMSTPISDVIKKACSLAFSNEIYMEVFLSHTYHTLQIPTGQAVRK